MLDNTNNGSHGIIEQSKERAAHQLGLVLSRIELWHEQSPRQSVLDPHQGQEIQLMEGRHAERERAGNTATHGSG